MSNQYAGLNPDLTPGMNGGDFPDGERMPDKDYYAHPFYPLYVDLLKAFLLFSMLGFFILYGAADAGGGSRYFYAAVMLVMPVLSTYVRRRVRFLGVFLLVSAALIAYAVLGAPSQLLGILGVIDVGITTVYGFYRRLAHTEEHEAGFGTWLAACAAFLAIYLLAAYRGRDWYEIHAVVQCLLYTGAFLFYEHHTGVLSALNVMEAGSHFSKKRTLRFNTVMFLACLGLFGAAFLVLWVLGLQDLISYAGKAAAGAFVRFLSRFVRQGDSIDETEDLEDVSGGGVTESSGDFTMTASTSPFWAAAQHVLVAALIVLAVVLVIYLLVRVLRRYHETYGFKEKNFTETKTFDEEIQAPGRVSRRSVFDRSPENKVRRRYYRLLKKDMGKTVAYSSTPDEIAEKREDIAAIADAYNQARYGQ